VRWSVGLKHSRQTLTELSSGRPWVFSRMKAAVSAWTDIQLRTAPASLCTPCRYHAVMTQRWKPSVTVAAVIERDGRYLLVEEHTPEGLRLNNPAGHLDPGESPAQGCARETLEETTHTFEPRALVGVYLSRFQRPATGEDVTYLRLAFCGDLGEAVPGRALDTGIVRTVWMTPDEVRASVQRHRSPLVLRCMEDHLSGRRFPLDLIHTDASLHLPPLGSPA